MTPLNIPLKRKKSSELITRTPDFNSMIRITFWNGLGFIFFTFIKSYVVIYFFGGSGIDLGIIMALQPLARLFSMPFIAYFTDRYSKKRLVLIGSMGRTIAYFLYWLSLVIRNLYMFGVGTFVQGLLVGFFWPPFYALISEKSHKGSRTHALAMGRGRMIGYGFIIGAFISIPLFSFFSFLMPENVALVYSPLLIFAIINLIAGHRFYLKVDENLTFERYIASRNNQKAGLSQLTEDEQIENDIDELENDKAKTLLNIGFVTLLFAILITSISGTMYSPFISAYLIENLLVDFSETIIPIIVMIVYFPAQVLSQLLASKVGKVFDRISPSISIFFINTFKALLIWLLVSTFTPYDFAIILVLLHLVLESSGYFIQAIMSRISIKHRGKMFGLHIWIDQLGRVIGPLIGGFLWDLIASSTPFITSIFIGLGLIPIFIFAFKKLSFHFIEQIERDLK
ncbi:MAG: MFS transporter [Candidatus Hermodarchaeota archaeon]